MPYGFVVVGERGAFCTIIMSPYPGGDIVFVLSVRPSVCHKILCSCLETLHNASLSLLDVHIVRTGGFNHFSLSLIWWT
jgi:hypothetical protein